MREFGRVGAGRRETAVLRPLEAAWHGLVAALARSFFGERARWPLWIPVAFGSGIGGYFALMREPPSWLGAQVLLAALLVGWFLRRWQGAVLGAVVVAAAGGGFAIAQLRTAEVAAPVLAKKIGPVTVQGRVTESRPYRGGRRIVIEDLSLSRLSAAQTPARARLVLRTRGAPPLPGAWVRVRAMLAPPPPPVAPGAFDFARHAYFSRLGAVGYAVGRVHAAPPPEDAAPAGWRAAIWDRRGTIAGAMGRRIRTALPGAEGAVAAALLTGERGAIPEADLKSMRRSGLAHLLAISGLHMGLVAGILFVVIRGLLAIWERAALRLPIKKLAAAAALVGAFAYLLLTGATVPTQRAFVMTALVMLAVVIDRTSLSMRLVAWAAMAVLLVSPESLLGPSFQMSFAATVALAAAYEQLRMPFVRWRARLGPWGRPVLYLAGVVLTTLIAGAATAPFAAFHFNRIADFSVAANLVAVPVTALWVMPWGLAAYALMPLGLEAWALMPMGWGVWAILAVARTVASWPGATTMVTAGATISVVVVAGAGLWLCLWRGRWRLFGVPAIAAGVVMMALARPPDMLVDGGGRLIALRSDDGGLALSSRTKSRFSGAIWLRRAGRDVSLPWPPAATRGGALLCDVTGCILRAHRQIIALVRDPRALAEDCRTATMIISTVPVRGPCPSARRIVDRFDLWRRGGHAFYFDHEGIRVETVAGRRGQRPWVAGAAERGGRPAPPRVVNTRAAMIPRVSRQ